MDSTSTIWSDFLTAATKDEMKKETNLVVLGHSKSSCVGIVDGIMETLGQPPLKKRDVDIVNYSYVTVGYSNRRTMKGDYSGIIHIFILTNDTYRDTLESLVTKEAFGDTFFLIAIDFRETASIMDELTHWYSLITDFLNTLDPKMINTIQLNWQKQVLGLAHVNETHPIHEKETPKETSTDVPKENTILPRGLLEVNLGVPTMVVCCNTEVMSQDKAFTGSLVDFIQKCIRLHCLKYGSSLAYVNGLKRTNQPILTNHILSLLFPTSFNSPPPNFLSKDEVFIPVGSDNSFLVADLVAGTKLESVTDFNSVIKRPPQQVKKQPLQHVPIVSEEAFFASLVEEEPKKPRRSIAIPRDPVTKQRLNMQASSPVAASSRTPVSSEMSTRSFFENLLNEGGSMQTPIPRKSVNVRNLRRSEIGMKKQG